MTATASPLPSFSTTPGSADVIEHGGRWFINMGRPGFNSYANNRNGYSSESQARAVMVKLYRTRGAATQLAESARELAALARLLAEQAEALTVRASQPSVHWGDAGSAQNLAHDARKLVARDYFHRAGNCEAAVEALVAADVVRVLKAVAA